MAESLLTEHEHRADVEAEESRMKLIREADEEARHSEPVNII